MIGSLSKLRSPNISSFASVCGFSLVEVVLALGIATFGILAIVSLLPAGIASTKDSLEETSAIDVLSAIIADRQATPSSEKSTVYHLPALNGSYVTPVVDSFGVIGGGQYVNSFDQAQYRIDYIITPPTSGRLDPYLGWFRVSWPANSAKPSGSVEGVATFSQ